ncbi:hypothetical protein HBI31_241530 [Parastagonospora nodorum]|nr:hypothetical protein HBI31_241530 [Parastagonospora nodorum]
MRQHLAEAATRGTTFEDVTKPADGDIAGPELNLLYAVVITMIGSLKRSRDFSSKPPGKSARDASFVCKYDARTPMRGACLSEYAVLGQIA